MNEKANIKIEDIKYSTDKITRKYVQRTYDNLKIETTYVDYINKHIICFSTQVGCNLGCKFCYNGIKHNFKRNLTAEEISTQIENIIKNEKLNGNKPILFSAMGIGEPLLNYNNLVESFRYLNNKYPNNKFALATTGISLEHILKLAEDLKNINFKLTISLHSAFQEKRNNLIPINADLRTLVNTVKEYEKISNKQVEWNYVLLDGINDTINDAKELFELLGKNEFIKINKFNKVENSNLVESKNLDLFISELKNNGMQVEYYETNGSDINGACGQMIAE